MRASSLRVATFGWLALASVVATVARCPADGVCYGPFRNGQAPGLRYPSTAELDADLADLARTFGSLRTYGTDASLADIPRLCDERGLDCYPGAWLEQGGDTDRQVSGLIRIAQSGHARVRGLVVGNETLLSGRLPKVELLGRIRDVQAATTLPVGTAEPWHLWMEDQHLDVAGLVDFLLVHVHPYWEGIPVDQAAAYVISRWSQVAARFPGKTVMLGETGWPSAGPAWGAAVAGEAQQAQFWQAFRTLSAGRSEPWFAFEAFDEAWKGNGVEGHWGLAYASRAPKPALDGWRTEPVGLAPTGLADRNTDFRWPRAPNATWHQLWLTRNGRVHLTPWVEGRTCWTPPPPGLAGGQYQWWVRGWSSAHGYSAWSSGAAFQVETEAPGAVGQVAPFGAQAESALAYRWTKQGDATWYQLWVGRNGAGTWLERWIPRRGEGEAAEPIPDHPQGGFTWWVRPWGPDGYGPWTGPMGFSTPNPVPAAPVLGAPVGALPDVLPAFVWDAAARATWYRVYVQRGSTRVLDRWTQGTVLAAPASLPAGSYAWWVASWNAASGQSVWSPRGEFSVP